MPVQRIPPGMFLPQEQFTGQVPPTIASTAKIYPSSVVSFISGTAQLETIVPPIPGVHQLVFIFTNAAPGQLLTSGNIGLDITPLQDASVSLFYDPSTKKYYPSGAGSGGGGGIPASPTTSVQFNDAGSFGGSANLVYDKANARLTLTSSTTHNGLWLGSSGVPTKIFDDGASLNIDVNGSELLYADLSYSELVTDEFHLVTGAAAFFAKAATLTGQLTITRTNPVNDALFDLTSTQTTNRTNRNGAQIQSIIKSTISNNAAALSVIGDIDTGGVSSLANIGISSTMRLLAGTAVSSFANYASYTKTGGTTTVAYGYYCGNILGVGTLTGYPFWYDGGPGGDATGAGVFRVNDFGIMAYYNPAFTQYTPGATDFERELIRWGNTGTFGTTNNAYIGIETGGTGTLRPLVLLGSSVTFETTPGTKAAITALTIQPTSGYKSVDGSVGATGTATAANTLTIKNGLVTNIA